MPPATGTRYVLVSGPTFTFTIPLTEEESGVANQTYAHQTYQLMRYTATEEVPDEIIRSEFFKHTESRLKQALDRRIGFETLQPEWDYEIVEQEILPRWWQLLKRLYLAKRDVRIVWEFRVSAIGRFIPEHNLAVEYAHA